MNYCRATFGEFNNLKSHDKRMGLYFKTKMLDFVRFSFSSFIRYSEKAWLRCEDAFLNCLWVLCVFCKSRCVTVISADSSEFPSASAALPGVLSMCVLWVNRFKGPQPPSVHAAGARENNAPVTGGQIGWQLHCWRTASQTHFFPPPPQHTQTHSHSFLLYLFCWWWTKLFRLSCGIQDDK